MKDVTPTVAIRHSGEPLLERFRTLAHRLFPQRPPRRLRVRETLPIGEKRQLMIVECGERKLLIGAAGNFLATLADLTDEPFEQERA